MYDVQVIFHQAPVDELDPPFRRPSGVQPRWNAVHHAWGSGRLPKDACRRSEWTDCSARSSRINPDGTSPKDNPFVGREGVRPEIWSFGHRNVQGATLNPATGELWSVEHGTRGGDEINIPRKGKDYGWPTIAYGIEYQGGPITGGITAKEGMEQPIYYWDPVIAPSGMTFYTGDLFPAWKGNLFIGGLGSQQPGPADDQRGARRRRGAPAGRHAAERTHPRRGAGP